MQQTSFCILLLGLTGALASEECSQDCPNSSGTQSQCDQLTCDKEEICSETEEGPRCINNVFPSCMDATCPEGTHCVELRVPSYDLSVGQCFGSEITDK
jgi:hypothetical protein